MEKENEKEEIIELTDEITPPVDGSKKENTIGGLYALNPALKGATEVYHKSKWKNYIVGKLTPEDRQYCEKVNPLDLYNTAEIRKYITAVEKYLSVKEDQRSLHESQSRLFKYIICFVLGASCIFWAIYAGMINFTK